MANLGLTLFAIALGAGINGIPRGIPDSHGRFFGWNDPMSFEHFRIGMNSVSVRGMIKEAGPYGAAFVVMQILGIYISSRTTRTMSRFGRIFYASQGVLFAGGWGLLLLLPFALFFAIRGGIDAEFFDDGPSVWMYPQASWVVLSLVTASWRNVSGSPDRRPVPAFPLPNPN